MTPTDRIAQLEREVARLQNSEQLWKERADLAERGGHGVLKIMDKIVAENDTLQAELARCREALEVIAKGDWDAMQAAARQPEDDDSVILEGNHGSDARYHYPYRMKVLYRYAQAALQPKVEG